MKTVLLVLQIIFSISLVGLILMQVKGTGFGRVWGGLSSSPTRRGLEGVVFKATFVLTLTFIVISILSLLV